jgi:glycosyltransferase involved in cell wall biosynthesis
MRCAIVHYWLLGMRGGEKVVEALCGILPQADIFTLFYDPEHVSPLIRSHNITPSFLNPFRGHYKDLLPLMPMALETFDLRDYDLVISSESGPAKGVLTSSHTRHVCYCHSPMRYLWDLYPAYLHDWTGSRLKKALMVPLTNYLRLWDCTSAARVDQFLANSRNVQNRIWRAYRRRSEVIYPPVAVDKFHYALPDDYYLVVSELTPYKRVADAVRLFTRTGRRLKIAGDGPEYRQLKRIAGPSVEFCGRVPDDDLVVLYSRSRAILVPGEEDFGIVAVEGLASGKAIIGLRRGGTIESVPEANPRAGFFYDKPGEDGLERGIEQFEAEENTLSPIAIRTHAMRFSEQVFARQISRVLLDPDVEDADERRTYSAAGASR